MRTNLLNGLSNVMKKGTGLACSWSQVGRMSGEGAIEHPLSTHSAPFGTRWKPAGNKYSISLRSFTRLAAMVTLLLTLACGNVWADTQVTFTANATSGQRGYVNSNDVDTLIRGQVTLKLDSLGSATAVSQIYNSNKDTKEPAWKLSTSAASNANKNYIELKASSGYNITGIQIRTAATGTTASRIIAVCFASAFSMTDNSVLDTISIPLLSNANNNSASHNITLSGIPSGTGCVRIYKAVRYDGTNKKLVNSGGTQIWAASSAPTAVIPWIKVTYAASTVTKYTLSYDANGGTGSMPSNDFASGTTVYAAQNAGFTAPSGKIFKCWNTQANGEGTSYSEWASFTLNANTTLYAQWITASTGSTYCINMYNLSTSDQMKYFTFSGYDDMQILDLEVPSYNTGGDNFWVGKNGAWCSNGLGNSNAKSANERLENLCLKSNRGVKLGTASQGVLARFYIYDNSTYDNLMIEFTPKQYSLIWGSGGDWTPVKLYPSGNNCEWTSEVVSLTSDQISSYNYYVGIQKADNGVAFWYKSHTYSVGSMGTYNKRTATWGGNVSTLSAGAKGFFRMWHDATDYDNWRCHFVPVYTLSYNANEGSGAPANAYTATEGDDAARTLKVSMTEPTRNGYSFEGWATSSSRASSGTVDYAPSASITLAADQELWAVWSCITPDAPTADKISVSDQCQGTGVTFTANTTGIPSYVTWYWQDAANGTSTTNSAASGITSATTPGTYTKYLRAKNTVCGEWSDAASTPSKSAKVKTAATISWSAHPTSAAVGDGGQTFSVTSNYNAGVAFAITSSTAADAALSGSGTSRTLSYTGAGSVTIRATVTGSGDYCSSAYVEETIVIAPTYTVTYNLNGGEYNGSSTAPTQAAVTSGTSITLPSLTPTKDGYVFASWKCSVGNTYHWESYSYTMTAANTTFTAQWVAAASMESGTLYTVDEIKPLSVNAALSSTGQYAKGISSNGIFTTIGDPLRTDNSDGTLEFKTETKQTVDEIDFTKHMWFKGASNVTSNVPTSRGLKFSVASAGTLSVYCTRGDRISLSDGTNAPVALTSSTSGNIIRRDVAISAAGTYYLLSTNSSNSIVGMKFVETTCDDPSASLSNSAYTIGGSALDLRTLWSSSNTTDGVTFTVTNANGTGATIAGDGYSFSATTAGTATISASQTSTGTYCDALETATVTVSNPTYTVTYATTGSTSGSAPTDSNSPYESGSTVTVLGNTGSLVKTGNVFLGWSDGSGNNYAPGETFTISGNTTLSPIWKEGTSATVTYTMAVGADYTWSASGSSNETTGIPNAGVTLTETYAGIDSGKGHKKGSTAKLAIQTTAQGATYENPTNYILYNFSVASGYAFTPSDITIKIANVGAASANNIKYKAVLSDGSSHSISTTYICTTQDATIETFHLYNEEGVTFDGSVSLKLWAWTITDKSDGGSAYRLGTPLTIAGVTESTATLYDISTSATNGTIAVTVGGASASSAEVDATVTITATPSDGYEFTSWSVTKDAGGDVTVTSATTSPTTFTMPAEDVTVSATFSPLTYTITYNLNGASWAGAYDAPATYTVGTGATLPVAGNMTNTGYSFNGWKNNSGLTGDNITAIGTSEYGDKEFWAKWTENTYDVTYNANGGTGTTAAQNGHYITLRDNGFTAPSGKTFVEWNTANDGSGDSYNPGEEVELTANLALYAIWATDYTITWDASPKLSGVAAKPNLGGGNYTITASVATWTGTLTTSMISTETSGVTITSVAVDNSASPKTITATFNVGSSVAGESISFTLDVPAAGVYGAKSSTKEINIDRCTGSGGGSDGVLFSAEFKDSGLGTSNICDAANTPFTFTTDQLKAAPTGGSIKAYTTDNLTHLKYVDNGVYLKGTDAVIQIDLDNAIATNDLFEYVNVHSSNPNAYLRHTSPTTTTDQIVLTGYGSKNVKVMLPAAFNGKTTLYIVKNSTDFKLHKAAIIRPAFLMLLDDSKSAADLSGTDVEMTTSTYLTFIKGGRVYYTSPSSGDLKIKESSSKKYIQFNKSAGYVKIVLNDALQEGDVIGFDSYNTNNLAFTTTATRSTDITSTNQLYTVTASSALKGQTTFYIWQNGGSADYLRGLQIARSGVAGGGGGTDKITTALTWDTDLSGGVAAETGDADFTHTVTQDKNSLGAITYSSNNTSVATVNASGKVHIVGAGNATITATMAASGCYKEATVSYNITVTDNCADVAGTISTEDLGCSGVRLTVTGHTTSGETVSYQWYKNGVSLGSVTGAQTASYTATAAGEYYVMVTNTGSGHCSKASTNSVTVEAMETATATKIVDEWYVKNDRRTPDIALVQTENADNFIVKSGSTVIWDTQTSVVTGFAGCSFYLGTDGIIYLKGQKDDETEPSGLTAGDETLTFIAKSCGGDASGLNITIHKQAATAYKEVAFVVDGTKGGAWDAVTSGHADGTMLYEYLDSVGTAASARKFMLYERNIYKTTDEKTIRQHYSQFDAILITDDPSTQTVPSKGDDYTKKGYVNAFGSLIDIRPILTMEAYVSALANWRTKGINGNPSSPNPRQYAMKLDCKNHAIFTGINSSSSNVEVETIDGVEYWTVAMVDSTKSPYDKHAYNDSTSQYPALQGFEASDVSDLMLLGEISGGTLYAGVERQEEPAARLLLLGVNNKALPNALTPEGKKIIENALTYLIETDMEKVDDCSNYFTDKTGDHQWSTAANWSKEIVPNSPYVKARILKPCVLSGLTTQVARVDIATSGKSYNLDGGECSGSLTIEPTGALIVGGEVRSAVAPYFNTGDLMPTTEEDLVINTDKDHQAALVFNNDKGDTKATVNLYSLGRTESSAYQFQYFAVPMSYIDVNPAFAGAGIYTYVWTEASGWERRGYYKGLEAFEGVGITTTFTEAKTYQMKGTLASTEEREITLTTGGAGAGQNIVGNSWLAPINIASLCTALDDDANIVDKTIYIYCTGKDGASVTYGTSETPGQWLAIPIEAAAWSAWEGLKVIPAMQGFCIIANSETTLTLNYNDHVRSTASDKLTPYLRAPKRNASHEGIDLIRIRVADSQTHTDLYLFEGESFSEEFDNGWEAKYMSSDGRSAKLYAETAIGPMAVVAQPEYEGTVLGFAPGKETEYTFTFSSPNKEYYLNDLKEKKSTLISEDESYMFTFEEGDTNRFYISKTPINAPSVATGTENTGDGVKARKVLVNDKLYIILNGRVYSAEGVMVK